MPTGLTNAITNAQSANGQSYQYGGNDCSGYMSNIYNDLTGKNERFTTDSDFTSLGFQPGYDPNSHFNIGTNGLPGTEGHMAGELGGVPVESASPTGHHPGAPGVMYGGDAYGPNNSIFTQQYHLPNDLIINNSGTTAARRYSAKAGDTFQHKHFRENVPGLKIKDQPYMQMKVTRTDPHTVWYSAADGTGSWRMDRAQFEQEYG